jgi:hypothetical protein
VPVRVPVAGALPLAGAGCGLRACFLELRIPSKRAEVSPFFSSPVAFNVWAVIVRAGAVALCRQFHDHAVDGIETDQRSADQCR